LLTAQELHDGLLLEVTVHKFSLQFGRFCLGSDENAKTTQELIRHANAGITMNPYAKVLMPAKRAAHLKLVGLIQPAAETAIGPLWSHAEDAVVVSS
jgi:hypothetical protein